LTSAQSADSSPPATAGTNSIAPDSAVRTASVWLIVLGVIAIPALIFWAVVAAIRRGNGGDYSGRSSPISAPERTTSGSFFGGGDTSRQASTLPARPICTFCQGRGARQENRPNPYPNEGTSLQLVTCDGCHGTGKR
ncbi:MAG TPA: hypothetical protein VH352_06500, partial [Pseudonocardiaceae bacterium]|nr:hypothetical protein [Pseudonocardiaceae bacterium]